MMIESNFFEQNNYIEVLERGEVLKNEEKQHRMSNL